MTTDNTLAGELLAQLETFSRRRRLPAVRALHLPPSHAAGTREGEFCALELEDGSIGLSYILLDDTLQDLMGADHAGLAGADALEIARLFASGNSGARRALGFAAVNALSRCLFTHAGFAPPESKDSVGMVEPVANDHIGMIGLFGPLPQRIVAAGARLTVIELRPELQGTRDGYTVTLDANALRACNKILTTSTILLNDSLDRMLGYCTGAAQLVMIGPSAGCLPDALFARGVTFIGGNWIADAQGFLQAIANGDRWSPHAYKSALRREDYPGFAALLERL